MCHLDKQVVIVLGLRINTRLNDVVKVGHLINDPIHLNIQHIRGSNTSIPSILYQFKSFQFKSNLLQVMFIFQFIFFIPFTISTICHFSSFTFLHIYMVSFNLLHIYFSGHLYFTHFIIVAIYFRCTFYLKFPFYSLSFRLSSRLGINLCHLANYYNIKLIIVKLLSRRGNYFQLRDYRITYRTDSLQLVSEPGFWVKQPLQCERKDL